MKPSNRTTGRKTYVNRSISRLFGILSGITTDRVLRDGEIGGLYKWFNENEDLMRHEPFAELSALLNRCLEDMIIDYDEREEILNWCQDYVQADSWKSLAETEAVRRLHGFLHGIIMDNVIYDKEVEGLQNWMREYQVFATVWPFCDVWRLLGAILADGVIDENERLALMDFCREFSERPVNAPIHDDIYKAGFMKSDAPVLKPVTSLCQEIEIDFDRRSFCFTGPARSGRREDLENAVAGAGGIVVERVYDWLNYLVVGAHASPCWVYSTYGRKIEQVIKFKQAGSDTVIVHEDVFMPQLQTRLKSVPDQRGNTI